MSEHYRLPEKHHEDEENIMYSILSGRFHQRDHEDDLEENGFEIDDEDEDNDLDEEDFDEEDEEDEEEEDLDDEEEEDW